MIKANTVRVGDKFKLINIGKNKFTNECLFNSHLAATKPEAVIKAEKDLVFEVVRKAKKIKIYDDGAQATFASFTEIAPLVQQPLQNITYEMLDKDLFHRCERISPEYSAIQYTLHEVHPRIFCAMFENDFDMAMTFLRYQEYYESSNPEFRQKSFTLTEYMRWYAKTLGKGAFTYTSDWSGFNIPSGVVTKLHKPGAIKDWNGFDEEMKKIYSIAKKASGDAQFYLIGMTKGDEQTLRHEVAHGMFYTNHDYKHDMTYWVEHYLPGPIREEFKKILKEMGYDDSVLVDELHAYICTGLTSRMQAVPDIDKCAQIGQMRERFDMYTKEIIFEME